MKQQRDTHTCNTILRILTVFGCFAVHEQVDVLGQLHKDIILPCTFTPGEDVVIHWYKPNNHKQFLHIYINGKDQLEKQDNTYKGRTELFSSEINNGNASLLLRNIQESDANQYVCYVGTYTDKTEAIVKLNVAAFEENSMEYDAQKDSIRCYTRKATPAGSVTITWNTDKDVGKPEQTTDSSLEINSSSILQCIIHHSVLKISWTGKWEKKASNATEQESVKLGCDQSTDLGSNYSVTWSKNSSQVTEIASTNNLSEPFKITDFYKNRVHQTPGQPVLTLQDLHNEDNGVYQCTIKTQSSISITVINLSITHYPNVNNRHHYFFFAALVIILLLSFGFIFCAKNMKQGRETHVCHYIPPQ
ncbi:hypothetical protein XENTR_v10006182 [Xenopus tropicalis]|uniref:HERV-H LTR-associating 2 n=1 Tax=Xenopus tropicalis TaxID=8364 RepID=A0A6I8Q1L4_XENTR|nr:hypothetical protein XENTR_v10006182 [Xenopus tropicalis]